MMMAYGITPTGADGSQNDKAEINKDIDTTTQRRDEEKGARRQPYRKNVLRKGRKSW